MKATGEIQELFRGAWREIGSSGFFGLSLVYLVRRTRKVPKKRGRESFLIARSETCLNTLLRTDLILTPHPSRLTFHVLSISRRVAGIRFIGFLRSVSCVWFDERESQDRPAQQINGPETLFAACQDNSTFIIHHSTLNIPTPTPSPHTAMDQLDLKKQNVPDSVLQARARVPSALHDP
jgi:hypothetical protein